MSDFQDKPVILEVAISGSTTKKKNPSAPETAAEIAEQAIQCLDEGATIVHVHSNRPSKNVQEAAQAYIDALKPVREKYPYAILYPTANFDTADYHKNRTVWPAEIQSGHYRLIAEAGIANMILLDTGVVPLTDYDKHGVPNAEHFWWYGFRPGDDKIVLEICKELGTGASISVFEPGWMKNVLAMVHAGTLPRGSKLNLYFAGDKWGSMAPPIPESLQLYVKMMEGLDLKWSVGVVDEDVMSTPLARMALELGGSFRVGLEDWGTGPSNIEQLRRAKDLINEVGRPIVTGAEAIKYLDIPFPSTRPQE